MSAEQGLPFVLANASSLFSFQTQFAEHTRLFSTPRGSDNSGGLISCQPL